MYFHAVKRPRHFDSDSEDDDQRKRPRTSGESSASRRQVVVAQSQRPGQSQQQQPVQQRYTGIRPHGSRTTRWLSDDSDNDGRSNHFTGYQDSAEDESNGSDEEFTLSSRSRPQPQKKSAPPRRSRKSGKLRVCYSVK